MAVDVVASDIVRDLRATSVNQNCENMWNRWSAVRRGGEMTVIVCCESGVRLGCALLVMSKRWGIRAEQNECVEQKVKQRWWLEVE